MPMSKKEFIKARGASCPSCGSGYLKAEGEADFNGPTATYDMSCRECGASWTEVYKLVSYRSLTDDKGQPIN